MRLRELASRLPKRSQNQEIAGLVAALASIFRTVAEHPWLINARQGQVEFPATQNTSSDPNTLDDYEEVSFTPAVTFGGGSTGITYSIQSGTATKIGNRVYASGFLILTSKGSSTGAVKITGLPYTIANANNAYSAVTLRLENVTFTGQFQGYAEINTTNLVLERVTEAGSPAGLADTNFANNSTVMFSVVYRV